MNYNELKDEYLKAIIELFNTNSFNFFNFCNKDNLIILSREGSSFDPFIFTELQIIVEHLQKAKINYSIDDESGNIYFD